MQPRISWCPIAQADHKKSKRQYAHTFHRKNTICICKQFLLLPKRNQIGILCHEVGHLIAGPRANEEQADIAANGFFRIRIKYRDSKYGKNLQYVDKRHYGVIRVL